MEFLSITPKLKDNKLRLPKFCPLFVGIPVVLGEDAYRLF
jgi:hypothetical protein